MDHRPVIKHKPIKCLEHNIEKNLDDLGLGHNFLFTAPKA